MRREMICIGTAALFCLNTASAFAAAGAAFPNVDVRAITPPGDVTERQLQSQGTPSSDPGQSGILQYVMPQLYAPAAPAVVDAGPTGGGAETAPAQAPPARSGNPFTRYLFPGLQGNPAGEAPVGGMLR